MARFRPMISTELGPESVSTDLRRNSIDVDRLCADVDEHLALFRPDSGDSVRPDEIQSITQMLIERDRARSVVSRFVVAAETVSIFAEVGPSSVDSGLNARTFPAGTWPTPVELSPNSRSRAATSFERNSQISPTILLANFAQQWAELEPYFGKFTDEGLNLLYAEPNSSHICQICARVLANFAQTSSTPLQTWQMWPQHGAELAPHFADLEFRIGRSRARLGGWLWRLTFGMRASRGARSSAPPCVALSWGIPLAGPGVAAACRHPHGCGGACVSSRSAPPPWRRSRAGRPETTSTRLAPAATSRLRWSAWATASLGTARWVEAPPLAAQSS